MSCSEAARSTSDGSLSRWFAFVLGGPRGLQSKLGCGPSGLPHAFAVIMIPFIHVSECMSQYEGMAIV